jgi:hypothetical protein
MSKDLVQPQPSPDQPLCDHPVSEWQTIETAPRDGTWFLICREGEDFESYEIGCFNPLMQKSYVPAEGGLFRLIEESYYDWRGFNEFHRATHWMPLPSPPTSGDRTESAPRSPVVETMSKKTLGRIAFEGASETEHAEHLENLWQQLVQAEPGEFAIEGKQWEASAQAVRLAVIEECAGAIQERRWSADPAAITGGSEVGFANERELAAFILGLEEAVNIVRGTVLK